jgi:hypothetical protein
MAASWERVWSESNIKNSLCYRRNFTMVSYAAVIFAPMCVWVYAFVAKIFGKKPPLLRWNFLRAVCSNIFLAWPMNAVFFAWATTLEHYLHVDNALERSHCDDGGAANVTDSRSKEPSSAQKMSTEERAGLPTKIQERWEESLAKTVQKSALFWIPATTFNFQFVPPVYRVIYTSQLSVLWSTLLSLIQHSDLVQ